jgi:hypothetical protein
MRWALFAGQRGQYVNHSNILFIVFSLTPDNSSKLPEFSGTTCFRARSRFMEIKILEKLIQHIAGVYDLMGRKADFNSHLPELEAHLQILVADGETDLDRLTVHGLTFLKELTLCDDPWTRR